MPTWWPPAAPMRGSTRAGWGTPAPTVRACAGADPPRPESPAVPVARGRRGGAGPDRPDARQVAVQRVDHVVHVLVGDVEACRLGLPEPHRHRLAVGQPHPRPRRPPDPA